MNKPRIAITMGDPAGIGPEVILKALSRRALRQRCEPILFGDLAWLRHTQKRALKRHAAGRLALASTSMGKSAIRVVDFGNAAHGAIHFGKESAAAGRASGEYISSAVDAVRHHFADALVTAPINKVSFRLGGWGEQFIGHTEMLAKLTGARDVGLMLIHGPLRAIHVTSHVALKDVAGLITVKRVSAAIRLAHAGVRALGISRPRIAVCGLNPHAGDGGLMGQEEERTIAPAIAACRKDGLRVHGPLAADTVWPLLLGGKFDVGVAMYHDQGQIPVKMHGFRVGKNATKSGGVNVTVGLPIIRTSPAHGTAFDLAGKGVASEESFVEAIELAIDMVRRA